MLKVSIYSFSYKKSIPKDISGNGGGFIFDCRCLPNPYKIEQLKFYNGTSLELKNFFETSLETNKFISGIINIIDVAVNNYISREFNDLYIAFGCTGGQHRSVFCAEKIGNYLKEKYKIEVSIEHIERFNWLTEPISE